MNRGWYHHSMAHKLASKGIKSKSPFGRVFANGFIEVEPVWWDDLPDTLYHATPTVNVTNILKHGLLVGDESRRNIENDLEAKEGLSRDVSNTIFFTEYPEDSAYFGIQALENDLEKQGKKFNWGSDTDYTILRIDTEKFGKDNIITYLGATIPSGEREYFVQKPIPPEYITGGLRVYYDKDRGETLEDKYTIWWEDGKYSLHGMWGGF